MNRLFTSNRYWLIFLVLCCGTMLSGQPPAGPGLGNLTYSQDELFEEIARFDESNGAPKGHARVTMFKGYMAMILAEDSGVPGGGFAFYDMSDPRNPVLVNQKLDDETNPIREGYGYSFSPSYDGDYVALQSTQGVMFWDWTDVSNPQLLSHLELDGVEASDYENAAWWVSWQAPYVYVGGTSNGLFVVDASDPTDPQVVKRVPTSQLGGFRIGPVHPIGNLLVASNAQGQGYATIDISDPENPSLISTNPDAPAVYSSEVSGGKLYGTGLDNHLYVHDISDPTTIDEVGVSDDLGGRGAYVTFQDSYAHFGASNNYAKVDISDPTNPFKVATASSGIPGRDEDFANVLGNLAFISSDAGSGSVVVPHQTEPDQTGPDVNMVRPVDGATNQALTSRVGLTFTDQIQMRSLNAANIQVRPVGGTALAGKYSLSSNHIVNFSPDQPLESNTTYEVVVQQGGVRDYAGNGVETAFTSQFSTGESIATLECNIAPRSPQEVNQPVSFDIEGTPPTGVQYRWDFGDGATRGFSSDPTATHTYTEAAHHSVELTVTDGPSERSCAAIQTAHYPVTSTAPTTASPIVYDEENDEVWTVNTDNGTVTAIDANSYSKLQEVSVGKHPQTLALAPDGTVWVANQLDATISIIDGGSVVETLNLPYGAMPHGVVFSPDGQAAYVSLEGKGKLLKFDPQSRTQVGQVDVGPKPHGIAVSSNSERLFVTRFISESGREIVTNTEGEVTEVSADPFQVTATHALAFDLGPDTEAAGRGVPNYLESIIISPDGRRAWIPSEKANIARGRLRDGQALTFESTVRAITSELDLTGAGVQEDLSARIDYNDRALPSEVRFSPAGDYAFVAIEGNNMVEVRDAYTGERVTAIEDVGFAPEGLAFDDAGETLFVKNLADRTVAVYDVREIIASRDNTADELADVTTVANELLTAQELRGKQVFYNADDDRMNSDHYISCATCHVDGTDDGRTWDFKDRGEGLRNTKTLRGVTNTERYHWSGNFDEIQDFEHDIRGPFSGDGFLSDAQFNTGTVNQPLGDPKAGLSPDLDALAAYVETFTESDPSPYRQADGSLTAEAVAGKQLFETLECAGCHGGDRFTNTLKSSLHDVGTIKSTSGERLGQTLQGFNTPSLRGLAHRAPYLHDGSVATIEEVLTSADGKHGGMSTLSGAEVDQMAAYLQQIDESNEAPAEAETLVEVTQPAGGTSYEPGDPIQLAANTSDAVGTVEEVQFYRYDEDAELIGTDTDGSDGWSIESAATEGTQQVSAMAVRQSGQSSVAPRTAVEVGEPQDPDLLVQWRFDEGSGTTATDASGNGHDGAIDGASYVGASEAQLGSGALSFSGDSPGGADLVEDADAEDYLNGHSAVTVSLWIKSDQTGTDRGFLGTLDPPTGDDDFLGLRYDSEGYASQEPNVIKAGVRTGPVEVGDGDPLNAQELESTANAQTTEWQHLALVWSSGQDPQLYIDGQLDTPGARFGPSPLEGTLSEIQTLRVGQSSKDEDGGGWAGLIDEVRIYGRALSASEIAELAGTEEGYEGGTLALENRDWQFPDGVTPTGKEHFSRHLAFNRHQTLRGGDEESDGEHDSAVLRVSNESASENLEIYGLDLVGNTDNDTNSPAFSVDTAPTGDDPLVIAPGASEDLTVDFIYDRNTNRRHEIVFADLLLETSDPEAPTASVQLGGAWQKQREGGNEPAVADIVDAFGFGTEIVSGGQDINNGGRIEAVGEEVLSPFWRRVDESEPIFVRQLDAFHSCCNDENTLKMQEDITSGNTHNILTHEGADGQSFLPRKNNQSSPAQTTYTPSDEGPNGGVFGLKVGGENSDWMRNDEPNGGDEGHHLRAWPLRDADGDRIPNTYLFVMDFSGVNYDFNDNVYYVTNIEPADDPTQVPEFAEKIPVDLGVSAGTSAESVEVGEELTLSYEVANERDYFTARDVAFEMSVPSGADFVSASDGCTESSGTVTCEAFDLPTGQDSTMEMTVEPTATGPLTGTATASVEGVFAHDGQNSKFGTLTVDGAATVEVTGSGEGPPGLADGLLVHWRFDEGSGTTATDASGNGHDGAIDGASYVGASEAQLGSGALSFSGDSPGGADLVEDADAEDYLNGHSAVTVSLWIKSDQTGTDRGFISTTTSPDDTDEYLTMRHDSDGSFGGASNVIKAGADTDDPDNLRGGNAPPGVQDYESAAGAQTTDWQHLALVVEDGEQLKLYVDGQLDAPTSNSDASAAGSVLEGIQTLRAGQGSKDEDGGGWAGLIDEVRIYGRALSAGEVSALANPSSAIAANKQERVWSGVVASSKPNYTADVVLSNAGSAPLDISDITTSGPDAGAFSTEASSLSIPAGESDTVTVTFDPSSTGSKEAALDMTSNDPGNASFSVPLYALAAQDFESTNEPLLAQAIQTLGYDLEVGWEGLTGGVPATERGDESYVPLFEKADPDEPVTITPVARYSPTEQLPFGWYTDDGGTLSLTQVGVLADGSPAHQMLFPPLASGTSTFDPGDAAFGLYTESNALDHTRYTEDELNDIARGARIYPLDANEAVDRRGDSTATRYLVGFEDASNGDYQDYVFTISNVQPAASSLVIATIDDQSVEEGQTLGVSVSASNSDGDDPSLSAEIVDDATGTALDPSAYTFTDNGDGTADLSWTPQTGDAGDYTATVTASDGTNTATESFAIDVLEPGEGGDQLLVHWSFDEGSGSTAIDASGNAHDGTITGASYVGTSEAKVGSGALSFAAGTDLVEDADAEDYLNGLGAVTVSLWVKADETGLDQGILGTRNNPADPEGHDYFLTMRHDASGYRGDGTPNVVKAGVRGGPIDLDGDDPTNAQELESTANAQTTEWQHLALVWEDGQDPQLYIDGQPDALSARFGPSPLTGMLSEIQTLRVGQSSKGETNWSGLIDEMRIYGRALSASEVAELANPGSGSETFELAFSGEGWSLMGLPLEVEDASVEAVFSEAAPASGPTGFDGTYTQPSELEGGQGYFVKYNEPVTQTVEGTATSEQTVSVSEGWNLVAGPSCEAAFAEGDFNDQGGPLIPGTLTGFDNGYTPAATTLAQGKGYFVKAESAGVVTASCGTTPPPAAALVASSSPSQLSDFDRLVVTDASGRSRTLYFGGGELAEGRLSAESFSLPPLPPRGAFDARFERKGSGEGTRLLEGEAGEIRVQASSYPVTVELQSAVATGDGAPGTTSNKAGGQKVRYVLEAVSESGQVLASRELGEGAEGGASSQKKQRIELTEGAAALRVKRVTEALPGAFALQGNYPNPVRTSTTLAMDLPERAEVTVSVYDALGRRVKQVERSLASGMGQTVRLEAGSLSSGVYFYRVKARLEGSGEERRESGRFVLVR